MDKEEIEVAFTGRELDAWLSAHNADDMEEVLKGFVSDTHTFCRSLANLYEENKVPLAMLGVCVKIDVSMTDDKSGRLTLMTSQLGAPYSLIDKMKKDMEGNGQDDGTR